MVANQTTGMASIPTPPQSQVSSNSDPESRTLSLEHSSVQQRGHVTARKDSSEDSFVSAEEMHSSDKVVQYEDFTHEIALECDKLQRELNSCRRQLEAAQRNTASLERQVRDLHLKKCEGAQDLKRKVTALTAKVQNHESGRAQTYQNGVMDGMRAQHTTNERALLLQQVETYKAEAAKWRMEAFRQGSEAVSKCWQASVDEAVRRERERDAPVIRVLRDEIAALKREKKD